MRAFFIIALIILFISLTTKKVMDAQKLKQLLLKVGFPADTVNFFIAQAMFESRGGNFNSNVNKTDNNLTGIIFINRPYQKATKGLPMPKSDGNGFYAHFSTVEDWARDYKRILSFGAKPIEAKTLPDFVSRLKQNGYFGGNEKIYLAGVTAYNARLS